MKQAQKIKVASAGDPNRATIQKAEQNGLWLKKFEQFRCGYQIHQGDGNLLDSLCNIMKIPQLSRILQILVYMKPYRAMWDRFFTSSIGIRSIKMIITGSDYGEIILGKVIKTKRGSGQAENRLTIVTLENVSDPDPSRRN